MYLARTDNGSRQPRFVLRESFLREGMYCSRDLADLGPDPGRYLVYGSGSSFYVNEELVNRLREQGVTADQEELEELLFPYVDPFVRSRMEPFRHRHQYRRWRPADASLLHRALHETQAMDRRRLHFLRLGRTSAETVNKTAPIYLLLLDKSRDEIEQLLLHQEQALPVREYQQYLFAIFELERFFKESYARSIPQALDRDRVDELFVSELCRWAEDTAFWQGFHRPGGCLPQYLIRYLIMYFDTAPEEPTVWARFTRARRPRHFHQASGYSTSGLSREQALAMFHLDGAQLAGLTKKDLTRLYRKKAHELHPDKGGDAETFIQLTAAYDALLFTLP